MAKRIFNLAKELGIESKAIVAKCKAEGISDTVIKDHMSTVSAGLEATIREWFSSDSPSTAIETTEHVDAAAVKTKKSSAKKKSAKEGDDSSAATTTTVEAPPTPPPAPRPAPAKVVMPAPVVMQDPSLPPLAATKIAPTPTPVAPTPPPAPTRVAPATIEPKEAPKAAPNTPAAPGVPARAASAPAPTPPSTGTRGPTHSQSGPSTGGSAPVPATPAAPTLPAPHHPMTPMRVAPMNVPTRPTSVGPAGPKLEIRSPVKLSGPKVVRIEAPDQVEAPRPRRVGPPSGGSGGGGGAPRPGAAPRAGDDDDRGRSPRRKTGPTGGPSSAGAGAKRSTGTGVPQRRRASSGEEWVGAGPGVFSEQDLAEREARLLRSSGLLKKRRQDLNKKQGPGGVTQDGPAEGKVRIAAPFTIKDLSAATGVKAADIVKKLFLEGVMATINSGIDPNKAAEIMIDFDVELEVTEAKSAEESIQDDAESRDTVDQRPRGPVVTILGHVDHGKTSLLDKIRNANVAAGEAGGITQRTSAFRVPVKVGEETKEIVFLDTPGHEAFTSMRARGANMTDVVVLVVSAPEGVMPQTIESINHAKAAKVPIVVALNKIDRADATEAQIQRTLGLLAEHGLNPVEWGGDTEIVRTSATTGQGIKELLETLDYQAQLKELKADFGGAARGTVIEARTEEGRGAVASILIQQGSLKVGEFIVAGRAFGRIRDITDDRGVKIREAIPPMPVQISGLDMVPDAGDKFYIVDSLRKAEEAAEQRRHREREQQLAQPKLTLDNMFANMSDSELKEINVVLRVAEQGTADVLKQQIEKITTPEVKLRVLQAAIGGITESDIVLAEASRATVIGFNVIASGKARTLAEQKGVEIRTYQVIYDITDDLKKAAEGMLAPELRQEVLGHAEVRKVFKVTKVGTIAGCYITDGTVQRDALIRVTRNGIVIENDRKLDQLKRFKDDAKDVRAGMECGMKIDGYDDIKEGDILECYKQVEVKRTL